MTLNVWFDVVIVTMTLIEMRLEKEEDDGDPVVECVMKANMH